MTADKDITASLLLIGNELLSGRTQDKNLAYIGRHLSDLGIRLVEARVIPDEMDVIVEVLNQCRADYDYVFTTGGIGPTHDDITAAAIARAFGRPLQIHPEAEQRLRKHYGDKVNAARLKMAAMPAGAELIDNPLSAAPGFQIENVFVLAGIPVVMQAMFDSLIGRLQHGRPILAHTLTTDRREGEIAAGLAEIQNRFPDISIGSYPFFGDGQAGVNLVLRGTDSTQLQQAADAVVALVESLAGRIIAASD
jgi:molybdenum cofactor synthesis domain-containing protein